MPKIPAECPVGRDDARSVTQTTAHAANLRLCPLFLKMNAQVANPDMKNRLAITNPVSSVVTADMDMMRVITPMRSMSMDSVIMRAHMDTTAKAMARKEHIMVNAPVETWSSPRISMAQGELQAEVRQRSARENVPAVGATAKRPRLE